MIIKITMNKVASYKLPTVLETDKRINLIYGLNGTGKSTLSNYLYDGLDAKFANCSIDKDADLNILVYNQKFIKDNFHESDKLKGIFTLSKENKEAEQKIEAAEQTIKTQEELKKTKKNAIGTLSKALSLKKQTAEEKIWEIKTKYSGGDRVLEFCLEGNKGSKDKLFEHLNSLQKPAQSPTKTIEVLKKEAEALRGENASKHASLPTITFTAHHVETDPLLQKEIIGNENSTVAALIKKLDNSDWVKQGLGYLPEEIEASGVECPFCQEKTITSAVVANIKDYFDVTYETELSNLKKLLSTYDTAIGSIQSKEQFTSHAFMADHKADFENNYDHAVKALDDNRRKIAEKINTPSHKASLEDSTASITAINDFITGLNSLITEHNTKIDNKATSLKKIVSDFWEIMRWDYYQTLASYQADKISANKQITAINLEITGIDDTIKSQKAIILEQQKHTVNIDDAIANINSKLIELGLDNFKIVKHNDVLYQIERDEVTDGTFHTLSEGEKMIISFLYFWELCKGKKSATDVKIKKVVVIDDPISSLSHVYVFNIGQLIKHEFFNSKIFSQVFVLTHSLYFFYELTEKNSEKRNEHHKMFRLTKNSEGTRISDMKYNEIQNDYHSYWHVIKDDKQPPALIANCMRNIIEYFFGFIEKNDLNNVFQKPELKDNKYQAFGRYINRESHSEGINVFDLKEFDYDSFKSAFHMVFKLNDYESHYNKMMK